MEYRESNMKRKIFLGIISILLFIFTGCGNQNAAHSTNNGVIDLPDGVEEEPPAGMGFELTNEDVFETGYYYVQYDSFDGAKIFFESNNEPDSNIEWSVYIVDNELSAEEIEALPSQNQVAINEGSANISGGQWIYVLCNINSKTASSPINATFKLYSFRDYI